mmetsp:Transcript_41288/g.129998  ORF Transcript_41288/g.129998 Transcript_41288/m.129998 type:complete len:217 (+) Transcript_41288:153-803(+)
MSPRTRPSAPCLRTRAMLTGSRRPRRSRSCRSSPFRRQQQPSPGAGLWTRSGGSAWRPRIRTCWRAAPSSQWLRASVPRAWASPLCSPCCSPLSRACLGNHQAPTRRRRPPPAPLTQARPAPASPAGCCPSVSWAATLALLRTPASRPRCTSTPSRPFWRGRRRPQALTSAYPPWTACCSWMRSPSLPARPYPRLSSSPSSTCLCSSRRSATRWSL